MTHGGKIPLSDLFETKPELDLKRPVPANTRIGVLIDEAAFFERFKGSPLPYPPISSGASSGLAFDRAQRILTSTVWGRLRNGEEGLFIDPSWKINDDRTLLSLDVDHVDALGGEVSLGRLLAVMPPELEGVELDKASLQAALDEAAKEGHHVFAVAARGTYPESGRDARLKLFFSPRQMAGTLREDGTMDFRERGGLHFAAEGDNLAMLRPPIPGAPGQTIFGEEIPPPEPKGLDVKCGEGVKEVPGEDGVLLYVATKEGVANFEHGQFWVTDLLEIRGDVDLSTGNVRSKSGSVHIRGSVRSGFQVEAPGDVVVGEVVEEADIDAGGNVTVAGGILMTGKNKVVSGKTVMAKFCQNAFIEAEGDVTVDAELSHCTVRAGGKVVVTSAKGMISGGRVECAEGLETAFLGNEARSKTVVVLRAESQGASLLLEDRNILVEELVRLNNAIGSENAMEVLVAAPEEDRRILAELIKVRARVQADVRAVDDAIAEERRAFEQQLAEKSIKVRGKAYSGVEIIMGTKKFVVREDLDAPVFKWDPDQRRVVVQ